MGILSKLFKKKKQKQYSDDEYIRSSFIHADYITFGDNHPIFYILFEFTNSYCQSAISIAMNAIFSKCVFIPSSIDKETEELDEDGYNIIISIPKNYLLIAIDPYDIKHMIQNIDIANPFINELINQLYENVNSSYFKEMIDDGIMNEYLFSNKEINKNINIIKTGRIEYTDIYNLLKSLPSEFTGADLLSLFYFRIYSNVFENGSYGIDLKSMITNCFKFSSTNNIITELTDGEVSCLYSGVLKHITKENLIKLIQPLYKRSIDEDELVYGDLSSQDIDDLFKEKYDRFNAVKNDNTSYMDIDEALSEDDPEYNNLQSEDEEEY